ncbi:hypothetical protein ABZ907_17720 [Nonomuraea wenchangensis]
MVAERLFDHSRNTREPEGYPELSCDSACWSLLAGVRGAQIAGRFTLIPTHASPYGAEWKGLIATLEQALLLHEHRAGSLVTLDRHLHTRTGGMIGALSHQIRGAAIDAILTGTGKITKRSRG